jgi:hypothetical protein
VLGAGKKLMKVRKTVEFVAWGVLFKISSEQERTHRQSDTRAEAMSI